MKENVQLSVKKREATGKGPNRRLRAAKMVPGVYYNGKGENLMVKAEYVPLEKAYERLGSNQVFDLMIEGETTPRPSLLWKVVRDPVKGFLNHVDIYGVDMTSKMRIEVPVEVHGEAKGVKEGGMLEIYRDSLEIESLPGNIPESIVIDVTSLGQGDSVHIEDIKVPEGVELLFEENFAILGVLSKSSLAEAAEAAEAAAEEGAEGEDEHASEDEEAVEKQ